MTEDRGDSLADQAATWVPPWERRPVGEPSEHDSPEHDSPGPAESAEPDEQDEQDEPVGQDKPSAAAEPDVGLERVAEPQPVDEEAVEPTGRTAFALIDEPALRGALEAILLVVDEPIREVALAQVLEQPTERIGTALAGLAEAYASEGRGFELRRVAGGWRLYTRPEFAQYVERFVLDGQHLRLTQAALETAAVIAYKQPVTRSRISAIRGVNCDGVIRTLISRGLVEECGTEPVTGAYLYRTTTLFLEKLGLDSVDELPSLAPFLPDDIDEIADAER
ncbi:MAG TPA: SMC-Scp complex subunit ScpB [Micromonosporaceae bacterium]